MRKFLPQRDVKIRADRTGPARFTAAERRALRSITDENLRRVLGETLLRSRDIQENFEAIEKQFPIQPGNVANSILEPPIPSPAERGALQVVTFTWAKGAGTNLNKLITQEFEPTHALLFAIADGPAAVNLESTGNKYSGKGFASGITEAGGTRPAMRLYSTNMTAGESLGGGTGPRRLTLQRSAEANTKNAYQVALVLVRGSQGLELSGSNVSTSESEAGVLSIGALPALLSVELIPAIYSRASSKLPTTRSAELVFEKEVEYAEGKKGTAGAQILVPTIAEREAEGTPILSWTFPDPGATAEHRAQETTIRLV